MSPIDVSVVVPTFRRPKELTACLRSVLAQQGVHLEVLVVDDSPEGSAREAVESLGDDRVRWRKREVPTGGLPALVRNEGAKQVQGEFVHFLDDDDLLMPGAYRTYVEALRARPDAGMAFARVEPFGESPEAVAHERAFFDSAARRARIGARLGSRAWMVANQVFCHTMLVNSVGFIRRSCIEPLGGYDPALRLCEEVDFYGRAMRRFGFVFIDQVLVRYRISNTSLMHSPRDAADLLTSYERMHSNYRQRHGALEFMALKVIGRTLARWL